MHMKNKKIKAMSSHAKVHLSTIKDKLSCLTLNKHLFKYIKILSRSSPSHMHSNTHTDSPDFSDSSFISPKVIQLLLLPGFT